MTPEKELFEKIDELVLYYDVSKLNETEYPTNIILELIHQAKSEWCKEQREKDAYYARYKGGLSKVEIWSLGNDELCDKIEELILNAPEP